MEPLIKSLVAATAAYPRWDARSEARPMATTLGKPSNKADREEKAPRTRTRVAWSGKGRKLPQETP